MRRASRAASEPRDAPPRGARARRGASRKSSRVAPRACVAAMLSIVLSAIIPSTSAARERASARSAEAHSGDRRWMVHLLRDHPEMKCTQIPEKPVIIGGDGGGVGKPLEDFLKESKAVTFGPTDSRGNSEAERLSGLDDIIVDVMAWAKKTLYEPDDLPMDLQADVAKHLCDMFSRQEKWLHPGLTKKGIQHDEEIGRWGWKDPLAMYLLPFWRDVYGPTVTYVHLVRDPRTLPIGNLHDKERDLQKAYFGQARWEELTAKFEEEWRHLSTHKSLRDIKKADVVDVLRATAYWTSVNFEIGAMIKGPLKNHAIVLRAEDLVQPDMDHWRKDANGQVLEKYQAAQKPIQALTTLLQLPARVSNELASHEHVKHNLKRFTVHRDKFVFPSDSPIVEVQTRIASKTLELLGYATDPDVFLPAHPSADAAHRHRVTADGEHMHEEHRYTPDGFEPEPEPEDENAIDGNTHHTLGQQLKHTHRARLEREKRRAPDTEQSRALENQLLEARKKTFLLETTKVGGKSLKDVIDQL